MSSALRSGLLPIFLLAGLHGCRRDASPSVGDAAASATADSALGLVTDSAAAADSALGLVTDSAAAADSALGLVTDSAVAADAAIAFDAGDAASGATALAAPDQAALPMRKEDWEVAIGKWTFVDGEARCECKATSSLLYWKHEKPKDFDASVEVFFPTVEASAGILFRERGEDFYEDATFYQYEWYTRGTHHDKRLSLMIKNPYWVQIVKPQFPEAPLQKWIRLRVRARGNHLETWIDGDLVFDKVDNTFVRTGRLGLHVFQPRPIRLRDFRLTVLGDATP